MLNFRVSGEGKTIVFLHGFLESLTMWDYLPLQQLGSRNIFIDLPGHGISSLTDKSDKPSIDFIADEVISVLSHLKITEFSIVGHSMGAYVGLEVKQKMANCKLLVLLNSNFWCDNEQKKIERLRVAKVVLKAKKIFVNEVIPNLFWKPELYKDEIKKMKYEALKMSAEAIAYATLAMSERKDFSEKIYQYPLEYVLIHGALDKLVSISDIESRLISRKQLHIIENAGHMSHVENSDEIMELLKSSFNYFN
jgi:2-succinyl-6-hydroxy-2,4-cyclohexadiene-1-carboxylate synthase